MTPPQEQAWPQIASGNNTLIFSPTGSGKTLAAFLACLNDLFRMGEEGLLRDEVYILYLSPLKALNNDIQKNLYEPLLGIREHAEQMGVEMPNVRSMVRTGDTPQKERQAMARRPPHVFITTPESLFIILATERFRYAFDDVRYVIVDEIHALCDNKRGVSLSVSLERLQHGVGREFVRVGCSATQRPLDEIASFLVGVDRDCTIVDVGGRKNLDVKAISPIDDLAEARMDAIQSSTYDHILREVHSNDTTLIFTNSRYKTERMALRLNELEQHRVDGEPAKIGAHHGSMSKEHRLEMEDKLKKGELDALVATSSLELGIDVGFIDSVVQLDSTKAVSTGLQRIGRAGHLLDATSKGRLIALDRDDLVECAVTVRAIVDGELDRTRIPTNCLDVAAQHVVGAVATQNWNPDKLLEIIRRSHCYRDFSKDDFYRVLGMLAADYDFHLDQPPYEKLNWDRINNVLSPTRSSRNIAFRACGTIPDEANYDVMLEDKGKRVGRLDEMFVNELRPGDIFVLGSTAWKVKAFRQNKVLVDDVYGTAPTIPLWMGARISRTKDLGRLVGRFRAAMADRVRHSDCVDWLRENYHVNDNAASAIQAYFREQLTSLEVMPTDRTIVVEHFRDELGQQNVVVHSPFGVWVNDAWGMALAERCQDELGFRPRVSCVDDAFLLTVPHYAEDGSEIPRDPSGPLAYQQTGETREAPAAGRGSPDPAAPLDPHKLLDLLDPDDLDWLLERALQNAPLFGVHFRHNVVRCLMVLRESQGRETPVWLQQIRANEIFESCRDHRDFPPVAETRRECLNEALDVPGLREVLDDLRAGNIDVHVHESEIPSPFTYSLLTMGAYFDQGRVPARERQSRLMHLHKEILRKVLDEAELQDLLDPEVVERVDRRLQCLLPERHCRDADEMARMLNDLGDLSDQSDPSDQSDEGYALAARTQGDWYHILHELAGKRRAQCVPLNTLEGNQWRWIATENFGLYRGAFANNWKLTEWEEEILGFMATSQPVTMLDIAKKAGRDADVRLTLDRLVEAYRLIRLPSDKSDRSDQSDRYVLSDLWVPSDFHETGLTRTAARTAIVQNHLRTHGPVTKYEIMDRYGFPMVDVEEALESLLGEGQVVRGEYVNTKPIPQCCWRPNLEEIHRLTLARLRREMEPASAVEFSDYMIRWQHCHPDTRVEGVEGTREVLRQLQGYENYAGVWERDLLHLRVVDYQPALLDRLCYSGEVFWRRFGWKDFKRGQIGFCFRDSMKWLPAHPDDIETEQGQWDGEITEVCAAIRQFLKTYGAQFYDAIVAGTSIDERLVLLALWHLVWTGELTNDSYECIRHSEILSGTVGTYDPTKPTKRNRSDRSDQSDRSSVVDRIVDHMRNQRKLDPTLGRWAATERLVPPPPPKIEPEQRNLELARLLLNRYGLLCRELLKREVAMPKWAELYKALKELEMRGEARRGYFVEDLPGEQYALPDAIDLLREVKRLHAEDRQSEEEPMILLNACDPANVFGSVLSLTDDTGQPVKWSRLPQAHVLFRGGKPILVYHDAVKQLADLSGAEAERAMQRLMELVDAPAKVCRHKEVTLKSWNDHPIDVSPARFLLQELGWISLRKRTFTYDGRQRVPHRMRVSEAGKIPEVFDRLGKEDAPVKYDERWIVSRAPTRIRGLFRQLLYVLAEILPEECEFHYFATHCEIRYRDVKCLRPWPKQKWIDLLITQRAWTPPLKVELGANLDDPDLRAKIAERFDAVKREVDEKLAEAQPSGRRANR